MGFLTLKPRVSWPSLLFSLCHFLLSMKSQSAGAVLQFGNETDRLALLAFKSHLSNDALASWNEAKHFCEWHGITCSSRHHQRVTAIELEGLALVGTIAPQIANLTFLRMLNLGRNSIHGRVPKEIGRLFRLKYLYLRENGLQGSIPRELGQLPMLVELKLSENKLFGSIPSSVYNISTLEKLEVALNRLTGSLPPHMGLTLPNLKMLYMDENQLSGPIPTSLFNASYLQNLHLQGNSFSGSVPKSLGSLQHLTRLNLGENDLTSSRSDGLKFLSSLTNCTVLEFLDLGGNYFQGTLPETIANLSTHLTYLILGGNQLSGSIPMGIENLLNLILLVLRDNYFTGIIPMEIGELQKLQLLFLCNNSFTGEIPSSLGNLTQLVKVHLYGNGLWGTLPSSLAKCKQLLELDLSQNHLNGTVPRLAITSILSPLIHLNLSHNALTGLLPFEMGNLQNLVSLDISENKLTGTIPNTLGNCLNIKYLIMAGNSFVGPIPQSMSGLNMMEKIDFSRNNLSGQIPKYLERLPSLQYLNLSFNHLHGEVPEGGVFSNVSAFSILRNDKLCGGTAKLHLPSCPIKVSQEQGRTHLLKVIIPTVSIALCLILLSCLFAAVYWRRKQRKKPSNPSFMDEQYKRVSYGELVKATSNFSPSKLMGVGSFSSVYKGIIENSELVVAVKVLDLQQRGASKSFMAECEALRKIRHRNLVKIITACSSVDFKGNDFKALVFEFMSNGSLEKWLHQEINGYQQQLKLNLIQRLDIAIDVASALDYLHNHCETPTVHCDLKPSNVLLDDEMCAHVGDFGLARFLSPSSTSTGHQSSTLELKGSIGYIAPEYSMVGEPTTHGDVYSYGILVLEMFTGKRPVNDLFKDGLDLHKFVRMAFPERVVDVVDPLLLEDDNTMSNNNCNTGGAREKSRTMECLVSILRIGLSCSVDTPRERMDMKNVVAKMHDVRGSLLC